nr:hypothetical protein [Escherichia coli]
MIKRDIGVIQAQRQVAAVALVPAFQPGIGGVSVIASTEVTLQLKVVMRFLCRIDK